MQQKNYPQWENSIIFQWVAQNFLHGLIQPLAMENDTTVPDKKKPLYREASNGMLLSIDQGE